MSEALGREFLATNPIALAVKEQWGVGDGLGISAVDPTLRGLVLGVSLKAPRRATPVFRQRWSRIAAHVAAGHRLRLQLEARAEALLDGAEAVLAPDGALKHATGEAKDKASRAALRGAAVALDKARTRRRTAQPDEALESWKGLVSGRWSLVDHFERDGRRYLVARRNDAQVEGPELTLRELQVLGYAALGHSNKLIGYEMGLSTTTVATHLMNIARKLKMKSRAALILSFQASRAPAALPG